MRMLINEIKQIIKNSGRTVLIFEGIYKSLGIAVLYPLFLLLFRICMRVSGYKYLTNEYILKFFLNPVTITGIILLLAVIAVYVAFEISCISVAFEAAHYGYKLNLGSMVDGGIRNFRALFIKENLPLFFHELIIFPFANIAVLIFALSNLFIPEYIVRFFGNKLGFVVVLCLAFLVLFMLSVRYLFVINFMMHENLSYKSACYRSKGIIRGRAGRSVFFIFMCNLAFLLAILVTELFISGVVIAGVLILNINNMGIALYLTVMKTAKVVSTLFILLMMSFASYFVISCMFFAYKRENQEILGNSEINDSNLINSISAVVHKEIMYPQSYGKYFKVMTVVIAAVSVIAVGTYVYLGERYSPFDHVELLQVPDITAHRGSSISAPENTMSAFEKAIEDMADYIELDVHTTLDGTVVVCHDDSLKRTAGVDKYIWQVSYGYIKNLDFGSWFSEEFEGERIPTLEEVMELAKGRAKINIEIKYSAREPFIVDRVVSIIEENDFVDDCIVTSSNYDVLMRVKNLNPKIKTGYVLSAAYGAYYKIDYVDVISINSNFVKKSVVDAIHRSGKEIYVWTVNSPAKVSSLASMGVDNIITDDPVMAREQVYSRYLSKEIIDILNYVINQN